jgi:hypothetical protein
MNETERNPTMDADVNFAAWMIAGGFRSTEAASERDLSHLRALKESRPRSMSLPGRLAAAVGAIRPAATQVEPECCPA